MAWSTIAWTAVTALRLHPWRSIATVACVIAALASLLRGGKYHHDPVVAAAPVLEEVV